MKNPLRRRAGGLLLAAAVTSVLALSACGSDSDDSAKGGSDGSTGDSGSSACVDNANKYLEDGGWNTFPTTLPKSPPARYTTLDKAPPTGKKVIYISQNFPDSILSTTSAKKAAEKLGWDLKVVLYNATVPDFQAKVQQAITEKPDFIISAGVPAAAYQQQIADAKKAGIAVIIANTLETPTDTTGFAAATGGKTTYEISANLQANKVMSDSNCDAKVAVFTLDYPILKFGDDLFKKTVEDACDKCKVETTIIQNKDIGSPAATQQMVAKLQADPSIKYAYTELGSLAAGLPQALKTAGLDDVKIFGLTPDANSFKSLREGTNSWWVNMNPLAQGYDNIDAAVRLLATGKPVTDPGGYPFALITSGKVPDGDAPLVPENLGDLYYKSWGLE